jgi:hypothetical protein
MMISKALTLSALIGPLLSLIESGPVVRRKMRPEPYDRLARPTTGVDTEERRVFFTGTVLVVCPNCVRPDDELVSLGRNHLDVAHVRAVTRSATPSPRCGPNLLWERSSPRLINRGEDHE